MMWCHLVMRCLLIVPEMLKVWIMLMYLLNFLWTEIASKINLLKTLG